MKIAAGIGLVILFFVFFAQASITAHFSNSSDTISAVPLSPSIQKDVWFNESPVLKNIVIPSFSTQSLAPTSEDWKSTTVDPLVQYLKLHNEKVLEITGYFLAVEKGVAIGGFKNMGAARAGFIASEMMAAGISAPRIILRSSMIEEEKLSTALKFEFFNDGEYIP